MQKATTPPDVCPLKKYNLRQTVDVLSLYAIASKLARATLKSSAATVETGCILENL
jgi:hypothetical protein